MEELLRRRLVAFTVGWLQELSESSEQEKLSCQSQVMRAVQEIPIALHSHLEFPFFSLNHPGNSYEQNQTPKNEKEG